MAQQADRAEQIQAAANAMVTIDRFTRDPIRAHFKTFPNQTPANRIALVMYVERAGDWAPEKTAFQPEQAFTDEEKLEIALRAQDIIRGQDTPEITGAGGSGAQLRF